MQSKRYFRRLSNYRPEFDFSRHSVDEFDAYSKYMDNRKIAAQKLAYPYDSRMSKTYSCLEGATRCIDSFRPFAESNFYQNLKNIAFLHRDSIGDIHKKIQENYRDSFQIRADYVTLLHSYYVLLIIQKIMRARGHPTFKIHPSIKKNFAESVRHFHEHYKWHLTQEYHP